jgi:hypothetical protein
MLRRSRPFTLRFAPLLVVLLALAPGAASAAAAGPAAAVLTPELEALAEPEVSGAPAATQAEAAGLPAEGPGSLLREGGRVIVEAQFEGRAPAQVEALKAAGAKVRVASGPLKTVALAVDPADLEAVAALPGITAVAPALAPELRAFSEAPTTAAGPADLCEGGSVISQGVAQLNVPAARAAFGARGAGVTVGVISDSYDSATTSISPPEPIATRAATDVLSDDLTGPGNGCVGQATPVRVIAEAPAPRPGQELTDEGRAMLQVVHDVAPEAQLAFATAEGGELEFARNIELLAAPVSAGGAGANVIVDDISYLSEPFFQDGPIAAAIQKVTAAGVTYLTAAGNDNTFQGTKEIGSWEAPRYRPTPCPEVLELELGEASDCMNFNPSPTGKADPTFGMEVAAHSTVIVDLQWAEPRFGVGTDLDTYLYSKSGTLLEKSNLNNVGLGQPVELAHYENETNKGQEVLLVIRRRPTIGMGEPRLKLVLLGGAVSRVEYTESKEGDVVGPTVYGHAGTAAAITLGAVKYTQSPTAPMAPEAYSSRGPATHYFGPVTSPLPAGALAAPEVVAKPNLTATDCASTTFFATFAKEGSEAASWHFCGTSEAAPHAAAVAALMHQINPAAAPAAVGAAMAASATRFTTVNSPNAVGAGMLNAFGALSALGRAPAVPVEPTPVVTITRGPAPRGKANRPSFEFTSSVAATFSCVVDGAAVPCTSPFVPPAALADKGHSFYVVARNAQGASGSSAVYSFIVDTKAPTATMLSHPKKLVTTRKKFYVGRFKLRASESPVTFVCQVDKEKARPCGKSFHRRFGRGPHVVKVKARDAAGNLEAKWTTCRFTVRQLHQTAPRRAAKGKHRR